MSGPLTRHGFEQLISGDLAWLTRQPRSLERDHIEALLREAVAKYYPARTANELRAELSRETSILRCRTHGGCGFMVDCVVCLGQEKE